MKETKGVRTRSPEAKPQILVVEDQPIVAMTIERQLRQLGYQVVKKVTYGEEAILQAADIRPDLVLMDIRLRGEMDGVEAAEQIRAQLGIPVVYVTGHADQETLRRAKVSAPFGYILKPFKGRDLEVAIEIALQQHRMEAELRESELRFRRLFEQSNDAIAIHDLEGRILNVNRRACDMLDYTREQLTSMHIPDIHPAADLEHAQSALQTIRERGEIRFETRLKRVDGVTIDVEISARVVDQAKGQVQAIVRDITERKWAAAMLRQHNRQLALLNQAGQAFSASLDLDRVLFTVLEETRRLLDVTACSIWLVDPETGDLVCRQATGPQADTVRGWRLALGQGLAGWTVEHDESLITPDAQADERHAKEVAQEAGLSLHAVLTVPLKVKADVIGVLQVVDTQVGAFDAGDMALLEPLSASAAIAVENARLFEQARQEIAERKQAEEALRESEERYRTIFETTAVSIWEEDFSTVKAALEELQDELNIQDTGELRRYLETHPEFMQRAAHMIRIIDVNRATLEMFGAASKEEIIGGLDRITLPETGDILREELIAIAEGRPYFEGETVNQTLQGEQRHVFVTMTIPADPDRLGHVLVSLTDITDRVQAAEERERLLVQIQAQAQQLQHVMDAVPEGVLLLDQQNRVVLANPVARQDLMTMAGANPGDTLTHLGDVPLDDLLTSPPEGLWHEIQIKNHIFEIIARPIETAPTSDGWVLVTHDVTQERDIQRRMQRQERLASVGQLAAGIAHDFNNIMAVISLYAKMLLRNPDLTDTAVNRLEIIDEQAWRASDLIQQILDFSRRSVIERRPMDLKIFLKEQVKMLQRIMPENIEIKFSFGRDKADSDLYTVNADPTRLQQAVMNLVVNARDAMPEGGELFVDLARITIEDPKRAPLPEMASVTPPVDEWIRLTVTDTGVGIPPQIRAHLFDPFYTTKAPGKGTGLGLAQVHGIVTRHEGYIDVASEAGQGATFTIYLPALPAQQPAASPARSEETPLGQGQTILVVEDNEATREAVVATLEMLNYRTLQAANGSEALSLIDEPDRESPIALILSDVVMPKMGGKALFQALKQRDGATSSGAGSDGGLKMVLMTGHPLEDDLRALREQGLDGWIAKPPDLDELGRLIARVIGG